jgi:hypothetical protein
MLTLLAVLLASDPPVTPPLLVRLMAVHVFAPYLAARLVERAATAEVTIGAGRLAVRRRDLALDVPLASIAAVVPWSLPLPSPGLSLRLASGARFPWALAAPDPAPLLAALGGQAAALDHPVLVYARARHARAPRRWHHRLGKFVLFPLAPALVLFNAHQHIAYGGSLGEYHLLGLGSYLRTLAVYWTTVSIYLVLYASAWRGLAEAVALGAARVAPPQAARVRRVAEAACGIAYWAGVPVLLGLRFLA